MNKKNRKWTDFIGKMATVLGCMAAALFLFSANTVEVKAVPLGSQQSGTTTPAAGGEEQPADAPEEGGEEQPAEAPEGEAAGGQEVVTGLTITGDSVNIRSDASTSAEKVGKATKGQEFSVTGEKADESGTAWYAITLEDGSTGYVRSDMAQAQVTMVSQEPADVPAEEPVDVPAEEPAPVQDEYYLTYEDDGSGTNVWYLNDSTMENKYKVQELLSADATNKSNEELMNKSTGSLKMIIVIMAVVIVILVVLVTVFIIKLRNADDDGYEDDDDDDDDDDEDDEDEEEEERPRKRRFGGLRRYDDDDDDDEDEEEDEDDDDDEEDDEEDYRPRKKAGKAVKQKPSRRARYEEEEDDEDEEEEEPRPRRSKSSSSQREKNWQSKNFLDDDDLEFEFLDLK